MTRALFCIMIFTSIGCSGIFDDGSKPVNDGSDSMRTTGTDSLKTASSIPADTLIQFKKNEKILKDSVPFPRVSTVNMPVDSIVSFAETLIGTHYQYGSIDPAVGFDCSGFITYVYNHFKIKVPRSSIDFTNVGKEIPVDYSKKGDLILFTGTDSTERFVGHMGIIISNDAGNIQFIHSSSGKANGVVITPLNSYYKGRFVKVIRI
ncbi:MAG: C40 family peptidase [Chitinophagaceae bacterium]|nr:C40 family peptidase [Chitinophagaceae bacterium]